MNLRDVASIGSNISQCPVCGEVFSTVRNFDAHRVGPWEARRCLTEDELLSKGYHKDDRGIWRKNCKKAEGDREAA